MYLIDSMIDLGLKDGQKWPSTAHRKVAQAVAIANSRVTTRDSLTVICQAVIAIPKAAIKSVSFAELTDVYGVPQSLNPADD
jgi:hypothetical protein